MSNETENTAAQAQAGNVYEGGQADARQATEQQPATLFRPRYNPMTEAKVALHDAIKGKADELAELIASVPCKARQSASVSFIPSIAENQGANIVLSLRHLEDCVYRAIKALTA